MKKYEKPELSSLALFSKENISSGFAQFEEFDTPSSHVYSYLLTSASSFSAMQEVV